MTSFASRIGTARRILISQTAGLGDAVHTLPAIHAVARSCPGARIDLLVGSHAAGLAGLLPAITEVIVMDGYPRPKSRWQRYLQRAKVAWRVARNRYDAIVEISPKQRSLGLLVLAGPVPKLAVNFHWKMQRRWFYSAAVTKRWEGEPFHQYLLQSLESQGFTRQYTQPRDCPLRLDTVANPLAGAGRYLHLSLFATETARQLPVAESRRLVQGLVEGFGDCRLVISCAAAPREVDELRQIVPPGLESRVQVFAGSLSVPQLTRLIADAVLHVGPDTGSLHLAVLTGCPSVSWFVNHGTCLTWVPRGDRHRVLLSVAEQNSAAERLRGIGADDVLAAVTDSLAAPPAERAAPDGDGLAIRCFVHAAPASRDPGAVGPA